MSVGESGGESVDGADDVALLPLVDALPPEGPIAPGSPEGSDLLEDLQIRIAELDAIAWNLPGRDGDLVLPPDASWPADES